MSEDPSTRAIFRVVALTAFVDGSDGSEADVVKHVVGLDPRFADIADAFELGVQSRLLLDKDGVEGALDMLTKHITSRPDQLLTFRLCARAMIADGRTEGDEAMVLGTLQEHFGLQHAEVVAMIDEEKKR